MGTVAPQRKHRKPDVFSSNRGRTHVAIDQAGPFVELTVDDSRPSLLTPSTARAVAKSLMVWASEAEALRASHGQDMPPTGQGEAP